MLCCPAALAVCGFCLCHVMGRDVCCPARLECNCLGLGVLTASWNCRKLQQSWDMKTTCFYLVASLACMWDASFHVLNGTFSLARVQRKTAQASWCFCVQEKTFFFDLDAVCLMEKMNKGRNNGFKLAPAFDHVWWITWHLFVCLIYSPTAPLWF